MQIRHAPHEDAFCFRPPQQGEAAAERFCQVVDARGVFGEEAGHGLRAADMDFSPLGSDAVMRDHDGVRQAGAVESGAQNGVALDHGGPGGAQGGGVQRAGDAAGPLVESGVGFGQRGVVEKPLHGREAADVRQARVLREQTVEGGLIQCGEREIRRRGARRGER